MGEVRYEHTKKRVLAYGNGAQKEDTNFSVKKAKAEAIFFMHACVYFILFFGVFKDKTGEISFFTALMSSVVN